MPHGRAACRSRLATVGSVSSGISCANMLVLDNVLPCYCNASSDACAGVHPERLYRILRFAVNHHCLAVVRSVGGGAPRFRNTAMSSLLREDHPNSLKAIVRPSAAMLCAQANINLKTLTRVKIPMCMHVPACRQAILRGTLERLGPSSAKLPCLGWLTTSWFVEDISTSCSQIV